MSRHTKVIILDDLDGQTPADETIDFGVDGKNYQIDLTADHASEFRDVISRYTQVSRKASTKNTVPAPRNGKVRQADPKDVREWARSEGLDVAARGRISSRLVEQYLAVTAK